MKTNTATDASGILSDIAKLHAQLKVVYAYLQYRQCDTDNNAQRRFIFAAQQVLDMAVANGQDLEQIYNDVLERVTPHIQECASANYQIMMSYEGTLASQYAKVNRQALGLDKSRSRR